jgi:hypothetical protein
VKEDGKKGGRGGGRGGREGGGERGRCNGQARTLWRRGHALVEATEREDNLRVKGGKKGREEGGLVGGRGKVHGN